MNTTLENLTEKVKENRLRNLAKNIVRYQNFRTSIILAKIDDAGLAEATLKNYVDYGISYIRTGKVAKQITGIVKYIDEYIKDCVQPLTPKQEEKRQIGKIRSQATVSVYKKEATLPVQTVLNQLIAKNVHKSIAVKLNDNIIVLSTEEEANGFIKGIKFMDKNLECKLINISYEVI